MSVMGECRRLRVHSGTSLPFLAFPRLGEDLRHRHRRPGEHLPFHEELWAQPHEGILTAKPGDDDVLVQQNTLV